MALWPFSHNWTNTYDVTISFLTTVLTSQSGLEQRVAERSEPRRTISTTILEDKESAQTFDRFLWTQQAALFSHADPVTGYVSSVRFDAEQSVSRPSNNVAVSSVVLSIDPGSDTFANVLAAYVDDDGYVDDGYLGDNQTQAITFIVPDDALYTLAGRHVFPFSINWSAGRADTFSFPRRVTDFNRGVVAVTRPIAFATRSGSVLLQAGPSEAYALSGFFAGMRGRQGEFWSESMLHDMEVVEIVSTTLEVSGADAASLFNADTVNSAVVLRSSTGGVYRRRILSAVVSGATTFLQMENDIPEQPSHWRRCSWAQVSRFSSDDLTVQWLTNTVAQSQVQVQTLPYSEPEDMLADNSIVEYYGSLFFSFVDPLDYVVNTETPLAAEWPSVS